MPEDQVKIKKESFNSNDVVGSDGSHYPYGTSLQFENELIEELGIDSLAVGDIVEVRAFAYVDRKSEHSNTDSTNKDICIQLTTVKIRREQSDRAEQLYGPNS